MHPSVHILVVKIKKKKVRKGLGSELSSSRENSLQGVEGLSFIQNLTQHTFETVQSCEKPTIRSVVHGRVRDPHFVEGRVSKVYHSNVDRFRLQTDPSRMLVFGMFRLIAHDFGAGIRIRRVEKLPGLGRLHLLVRLVRGHVFRVLPGPLCCRT